MADIVEESHNPASTIAKSSNSSSHKAQSGSTTSTKKKKGAKKGKSKKAKQDSEGSGNPKPENSKSTGSTGGKKGSQKSSNAGNTEGKHVLLTGAYNLKSGIFDSDSDSDSNSDSDSGLSEKEQCSNCKHNSKDNAKPSQSMAIFRDSLLYDTGSTDHIVNSRKWFTSYTPNSGQIKPIYTGGGPVTPKGIGTAEFRVLMQVKPPKYNVLVLQNTLLIPQLDVNLLSGIRHYRANGVLIKQTLYGANYKPMAVLDFQKSGFFLQLENIQRPETHYWNHCYTHNKVFRDLVGRHAYPMVVEIPAEIPNQQEYIPISDSSDEEEGLEIPEISKPSEQGKIVIPSDFGKDTGAPKNPGSKA
jgi:hypothetical protein